MNFEMLNNFLGCENLLNVLDVPGEIVHTQGEQNNQDLNPGPSCLKATLQPTSPPCSQLDIH